MPAAVIMESDDLRLKFELAKLMLAYHVGQPVRSIEIEMRHEEESFEGIMRKLASENRVRETAVTVEQPERSALPPGPGGEN